MATLTGQFISTTYFPLLQIGTADNGVLVAWPGNLGLQNRLLEASSDGYNTSTVITGLGTRAAVVVIDHSESNTGVGDSSFGGLFLKNQTEVSNKIFGVQTRRFNTHDGLSFVQAALGARQSKMFLTSNTNTRGALFVGFMGTELSGNTSGYITSGGNDHELYVRTGIIFPDVAGLGGFLTSERNLTLRTRGTGRITLTTQDSTGSIVLIGKSPSGSILLTTVPNDSTAGNINIITGSNTPSNIQLSTSLGSGNIGLSTKDTNNVTISSGAATLPGDGLVLTRPGGTAVVTIRPSGGNAVALLNIDANDTVPRNGIQIKSQLNESLITKRSTQGGIRRLFIGDNNNPWTANAASEGGIVMYGNPRTLELRGQDNFTNGSIKGTPQLEIHGEVKMFPPVSGNAINLFRISTVTWASSALFASFGFTFAETNADNGWLDNRWVQYILPVGFDRFITNAAVLDVSSNGGVHFGVDFAVANIGLNNTIISQEDFWVGGFTILATRYDSNENAGRGSCSFFLPANLAAYVRRTRIHNFEDGINDPAGGRNRTFYMRSKAWKIGI